MHCKRQVLEGVITMTTIGSCAFGTIASHLKIVCLPQIQSATYQIRPFSDFQMSFLSRHHRERRTSLLPFPATDLFPEIQQDMFSPRVSDSFTFLVYVLS